MQQHLLQVAEHTNTPTSSRRVALTQQGSPLPISTLGPAFSTTCRLPATTHCPAQPAHPQAHPQQPHTARAPAGRHHRPKAGPLPHSMVTPLHFIVPVLNPGSVPARPSPAARRGAAPWAGKHPISVEKAPAENSPSGADLTHRLHRPAAQQHTGQYSLLRQARDRQGAWELRRTGQRQPSGRFGR